MTVIEDYLAAQKPPAPDTEDPVLACKEQAQQALISDRRISEHARERIQFGVQSNDAHQLASDLMAYGLTDSEIECLFVDPNNKISKLFPSAEKLHDEIRRWRRCSLPVILKRKDWRATADEFHARLRPTMRHWNGDFLDYAKGAYHDLEDAAVASDAFKFLDYAVVKVLDKETDTYVSEPYNPESRHCSELVHALRCIDHIGRDDMAPPCWLNDAGYPPAAECVSMQNCILHVPTRKAAKPTPNFFTRNALDFNYDPNATCPLWIKTLDEYWPPSLDGTPAGEVTLLQEILGYLLLAETAMQKLFVILGPGRSGKGTIARIITMLLGELNVAAPSLHSLALEPFGRQSLIAKTAAIISEMALGPKDDKVAVTSHLKAISGEDKVEVNRKNRVAWIGKLLVRFVMLTNKIPDFADDSSAFSARLIVLRMTKTFVGNENIGLGEKLKAELPGILNWSLVGYDRLKANKRFTETESSLAAKEEFKRLASPTSTFIDECCVVEVDAEISEAAIYGAYKQWCDSSGAHPCLKSSLCEAVLAAAPSVKHHRITPEGGQAKGVKVERPRGLKGIRLALPRERAAPNAEQEVPF